MEHVGLILSSEFWKRLTRGHHVRLDGRHCGQLLPVRRTQVSFCVKKAHKLYSPELLVETLVKFWTLCKSLVDVVEELFLELLTKSQRWLRRWNF